MIQFATAFPDAQIVATLSRQLGWSHFVEVLPIKDPLKREFYVEMCRVEGWSVRQLRERIDSMLFERTALSKKPEALIRKELSALRDKGEVSPITISLTEKAATDNGFGRALERKGKWRCYAGAVE